METGAGMQASGPVSGRRMRLAGVMSLRAWCAAAAVAGLAGFVPTEAAAQGPGCTRMQFEAAVTFTTWWFVWQPASG